MTRKAALLSTCAGMALAVAASLFLVSSADAGECFELDGAALGGHDPVQKQWRADIPGKVGKADQSQPAVSGQTQARQ
jgi:hypothetical protein